MAKRLQRRWTSDGQPLLDDPRREDRLFEGQVDHLVRGTAGRRRHVDPVALSQVGDALGTNHGIGRLDADRIEEEPEPTVEVPSLPHPLERVVAAALPNGVSA